MGGEGSMLKHAAHEQGGAGGISSHTCWWEGSPIYAESSVADGGMEEAGPAVVWCHDTRNKLWHQGLKFTLPTNPCLCPWARCLSFPAMDPSLQSSVGSEAKWPWAVLNACAHLPSSGWIQKVHGHLPYVNHIVGNLAGGRGGGG